MHHENSWISCHRRATNSCRPSFSEEAPNVQQAKCPTTKPWSDNKESCFGNNSWLIWCKFTDSQTHKKHVLLLMSIICSRHQQFAQVLRAVLSNWIVCLFIIIVSNPCLKYVTLHFSDRQQPKNVAIWYFAICTPLRLATWDFATLRASLPDGQQPRRRWHLRLSWI